MIKKGEEILSFVTKEANEVADKVIGKLEDETEEQRQERQKKRDEQKRHLEEDLTPYLFTCAFNVLAGLTLIGLVVYEFVYHPLLNSLGRSFLGGMSIYFPFLWTLFCLIPMFIGLMEIGISLVGLGSAALERAWHEASILDVLLHHAPEGRLKEQVKRLPLHCEARETYLRCMVLFVLVLLIVNGSVYIVLKNGVSGVSSEDAINADEGAVRFLLDYSGAIFNECCARNGNSKHGFVEECKEDGKSNPCTLPTVLLAFKDQICPCYRHGTAEDFQRYSVYANESDLCGLMEQAVANISDSDTIPGTGFSIRNVIPKPVYGAYLVGDMADYACGVGFARGFQFAMTKWMVQSLEPYVVFILALSGIQALVLLLSLVLTCTHDVPEESEAEIEARLRAQNGLNPISGSTKKMKRSASSLSFTTPRLKAYYRNNSLNKFSPGKVQDPSVIQLYGNSNPIQPSSGAGLNQGFQLAPSAASTALPSPDNIIVTQSGSGESKLNFETIHPTSSKSAGHDRERDGSTNTDSAVPPRPPRRESGNSKLSQTMQNLESGKISLTGDQRISVGAPAPVPEEHHHHLEESHDHGSNKRGFFTNKEDPPI